MPNPAIRSVRLVKELALLAEQSGDAEARVSFTSIEGYLMAKTLVEGLRRAGRAPTRASLQRALESVRDWDCGGLTVNFANPGRQGVRYVELSLLGAKGRLYQ
jgi:hypothetical protein